MPKKPAADEPVVQNPPCSAAVSHEGIHIPCLTATDEDGNHRGITHGNPHTNTYWTDNVVGEDPAEPVRFLDPEEPWPPIKPGEQFHPDNIPAPTFSARERGVGLEL